MYPGLFFIFSLVSNIIHFLHVTINFVLEFSCWISIMLNIDTLIFAHHTTEVSCAVKSSNLESTLHIFTRCMKFNFCRIKFIAFDLHLLFYFLTKFRNIFRRWRRGSWFQSGFKLFWICNIRLVRTLHYATIIHRRKVLVFCVCFHHISKIFRESISCKVRVPRSFTFFFCFLFRKL